MLKIVGATGKKLRILEMSKVSIDRTDLTDVTCAWYSRDIFAGGTPSRDSAATQLFFSLVNESPRLQWLHVISAAVDVLHYQPSRARGVRLSTSSGIAALPIAQCVVGAVLAQSRGFGGWFASQQRREWAPILSADAPRDLAGQHAVIVGLGPIGQEIARLLSAVGLRTTGVRKRAVPCSVVDSTLTFDEIDAALADCDWLILCCPLTLQTRGLINRERIDRLPHGARIANVGRGALLDEVALIAALETGRLAGAYLDVFEQEPLPAESPLWSAPGAWLSPHNSALSSGNGQRDAELFLSNLRCYMLRTPLRNEADSE
ncbi:D-2-hydroxyacid dehydrogenase [Variovorax terrae]|uniref:D-2-hydroxyacid dehydrogenase n=1 Tax=Variovorax terrae TaxID=2923278 RepID=A0A9X2AS39_9BURK|nr:D-2-hydroxyacid dehydrogenase [Variovorax terrae]MCJ0766177.1 D-2-hydroxyacid dehydrogenase [Variovorax terrae]